MRAVHDFYNEQAADYDQPGNSSFYENVASALVGRLGSQTFQRILEVGAGTGFATTVLRNHSPRASITALEPAQAMAARGRRRVPEAHWVEQSLLEHDGDGYDLVLASMAYHWLDLSERVRLNELAVDGTLALSLAVTDPQDSDQPEPVAKRMQNGNILLRRLAYRLRPAISWSKADRRSGLVIAELESAFASVEWTYLTFTETFRTGEDYVNTLRHRGSLLALFSSRAEEAHKELSSTVARSRPTTFKWRIALIVARN
jgi:SAM-dependent methyltransferase